MLLRILFGFCFSIIECVLWKIALILLKFSGVPEDDVGLVREDCSCVRERFALAVNIWTHSGWEILRGPALGGRVMSQNVMYVLGWQIT